MSVNGFNVSGTVHRYNYKALDNNDQFSYPIKAFSDYSLYNATFGSGNCFVSTVIIPAGSFINGAKVRFLETDIANSGAFYILNASTKEVLSRTTFPFTAGWISKPINFLCPVDCVFAVYGKSIARRGEYLTGLDKITGEYLFSEGLNLAANGGGLNVGDIASISTTSSNTAFAIPVEISVTKEDISAVQKNDLFKTISTFNASDVPAEELIFNIISGKKLSKETLTHRGITYTWNGNECTVSGTATGGKSQYNLFFSSTDLPDGIAKGRRYFINANSDYIHVIFYAYINNAITALADSRQFPIVFKYPDNATGCVITIEIAENVSVNEVLRPVLYQMMPSQRILTEDIYNHGPIISFIDDDTGSYAPSIWGEIIAETNIRMGFACITGLISGEETTSQPEYQQMTVSELRSFYDDGNEVYSHSYTHPAFYASTADEIERQCRLSKQWLDSNGFGRTSDIIVYPGGLGEAKVDEQKRVRQFYRYGIDTYGGLSDEPILNPYSIHRFNADTASLAELKSKIDEVVAKNGLLVLMNHAYQLNLNRTNQVSKMISAIQYAKNAGVTILPFGEAIRRIYGWEY